MKIKEKVLLIEDERTIRGFMQAILTANGYDVLMAGTGAMANTMISSHCPDLIILDLGLPDMDGMNIISAVRQWTQIPIVVVFIGHERRARFGIIAHVAVAAKGFIHQAVRPARAVVGRKAQREIGA